MTLWILLAIVIAIIAFPFVTELARKPVDPVSLHQATGNFAQLRDGVTYYQWHGSHKGQVIVMVHGLTTPSWIFTSLISGLAHMGFKILTYDLYGRGLSERPYAAYDRALYQRQLHDLLKELGIAKDFVLFGYSMGGAIAAIFAAQEPKRVDRLILLAPAGMEYTPASLLERCARWGRFGDWLWGALGGAHIRKAARKDAQLPTTITDLEARMVREVATKGYLSAVLSSERHMLGLELESEHRLLGESHVAVLAIWGENDRTIPVSALGKLAQWNRDAYKYVIPGADHSLGYTKPKQVLGAIQENLREV